jgi:putative PIN family toxin of toxin-antitoxin system
MVAMSHRVVIDTNVLVGAAFSAKGGSNREVLRRCLKGDAQPVVGVALLSEYEELFLRASVMAKSPLSGSERRTLLEAFLSVCEWVKIYYLWRPNLPDEADNHLIELAIAGAASIIVTNNVRDVARGELTFPGLQILTPSRFLKTI